MSDGDRGGVRTTVSECQSILAKGCEFMPQKDETANSGYIRIVTRIERDNAHQRRQDLRTIVGVALMAVFYVAARWWWA